MSEVPRSAQPKEEFSFNTFIAIKLQEASFFSDKHDTFKTFLENNQISPKRFINILQHALQQVTNKKRIISDVTPASTENIAKVWCEKEFNVAIRWYVTPYNVICHVIIFMIILNCWSC